MQPVLAANIHAVLTITQIHKNETLLTGFLMAHQRRLRDLCHR
jgi:hypothetical protein